MIRLANSLAAHKTGMVPSVLNLFRNKNMPYNIRLPILAPELRPKPNSAPADKAEASHFTMAHEDWDVMFRAVTARLEGCTGDMKAKNLAGHVPDAPKSVPTTVSECVEALNQLHAALESQRQLCRELTVNHYKAMNKRAAVGGNPGKSFDSACGTSISNAQTGDPEP